MSCGGTFDYDRRRETLEELDAQTAEAGFWDDAERAQTVVKEQAKLKAVVGDIDDATQNLEEGRDLYELAREESDEASIAEAWEQLQACDRVLGKLEFRRMLSGEYDGLGAVLSINAGAGGVDSQDFAEILLRMYVRWGERAGHRVTLLDVQEGEQAGIRGAEIEFDGEYAYGYLRSEIGVHRLVRISPFDAQARRQTSFVSVMVIPDIEDDKIEIEVRDADLRVDTYRASGKGGQHVNKTDSAVRLTHLPSGIVVACQAERSQHKNHSKAMHMLKARLWQLEQQKRDEQMSQLQGEKKKIEWGSQIRSYVIHPYRQVADHRNQPQEQRRRRRLRRGARSFYGGVPARRGEGRRPQGGRDRVNGFLFTALDWRIAWRHLRADEKRPAWIGALFLGSVYLLIVGNLLVFYSGTLEVAGPATVIGPFGPVEQDMGPTPYAQYIAGLGVLTMGLGALGALFGAFAYFFNLLPTIITGSVLLGCAALVVVLSLMSGLEGDLRDKILNQKAHIRVSQPDGKPFTDYDTLADALAQGEGVAGASPYLEGEIMVRSGLNRQGAILSGIIPSRQTEVSNLAELVENGEYEYLARPQDIPDADPFAIDDAGTPWRLRHLEDERKKAADRTDNDDEEESEEPSLGVAGEGLLPTLNAAADDQAEGGAEARQPIRVLPQVEGGTSKLPPLPVQRGEPEDDEDGEDDGWEDPQDFLSELPPPPTPEEIDGEDEAPDEDDGWEDPEVEVAKLREQGVLPPDAGGQTPEELDQDAPPEPEGEEGDDDDVVLSPILIGRELAMELGVRLGADVQLITPVGRTTPAGQFPGVMASRVGGVFFSGMYEYDRKNVYAPLDVVQRFLLTGDRVSGIEVKLEDVEDIDAGKAEVERIVASLGRDEELLVEDWRDLNRNLFSAMFLEKVAMFIALLFVVLVASFGILASNLMSVMEKSKEIAILKAMGMGDDGILRVFVAEGLCVGILGSLGGILLGLWACYNLDKYGLPLNENLYYIEKLPVVVNPFEVVLVGVAALVIVCVSSLYPAFVASALRPVDALRQADQ